LSRWLIFEVGPNATDFASAKQIAHLRARINDFVAA
jgi:hypothetical protein